MTSKSDMILTFFKIHAKDDFLSFFWHLITDFFNQKSLLGSRKDLAIKKLEKPFPDYNGITTKAINSLDYLMEENPKIIYQIILDFFNDKALITKLIDIVRKAKNSNRQEILYKLDFISDFYESIEVFKFPTTLICYDSVNINCFSSKDSILKHLKNFGLTNIDINNIRLIRNSINHKFLVNDEFLITEKQKKIPTSEINRLYELIENISSWLTTFTFRSFYLIPKFGFISIMTFYSDITENEILWEKHVTGIKTFYKDFINQVKSAKETDHTKKKSLKKRFRKIKRKAIYFIKYKILKRKKRNPLPDNFHELFFKLLDRLYFHSTTIYGEINNLSLKMDNNIIQNTIMKVADWINKKSIVIKEIKEYFIEHPDEINDLFEDKLPPTRGIVNKGVKSLRRLTTALKLRHGV